MKLKSQTAALEYLNEIKETKSKMSRRTYSELKIQPYLTSRDINLRRKQMLFKVRNRMMSTSENFGKNILCRICKIEPDTTHHIFSCVFLKCEVPEVLNMDEDEIDAIYSENLDKSFATLNIFEKLWRKREVILESARNDEKIQEAG